LARLARSYGPGIRPVEDEEGDRPAGAGGGLVVKLLPDDALGRPTQAIPIEGHRPAQIIYGQRDEEDLRSHAISCRAVRESCAALKNLLLFSVARRRRAALGVFLDAYLRVLRHAASRRCAGLAPGRAG
jgi:hypothetical protein